jgi:hypothetical protein
MSSWFVRGIQALDRAMDRAGALVHRYRRPLRDGLILVGLIRMAWYFWVQGIQPWTFPWVDVRAYWGIDLAHPYAAGIPGDHSAYLYSPAFAQLMAPFSLLPFEVFAIAWTALLVGILVWLVKPWPPALLMLALPAIFEVLVGNVHLIIAAVVVLSFRWPGLWAFPLFTKITPAVGILWDFFRGSWRRFLGTVGLMVAIFGISFALNPTAWFEWVAFLTADPGGAELIVPRVLASVLMVAFGALTGRRWLVAVAVWLSLPVIYINSWVVLFAIIRLKDRVPAVIPGTTAPSPVVPVTARTTPA